jgi:hypothetical protein
LQYFGEYASILYGDSSKCINLKMVTGLIHNCNTGTSGQWNIIIRLHIDDMVSFFHSSLSTFENVGVIWGILLFYEDIVLTVETS